MIKDYFEVELLANPIALPLTDIETIERFSVQSICPIPGVPEFWWGVVNQKGSLLWVLDGMLFFEQEQTRHSEPQLTAVILKRQVQDTQRRVALVVKQLLGVFAGEDTQLQSQVDLLPRYQQLCGAMVNRDDRSLAVMDTEAFFQALHSQTSCHGSQSISAKK